MKSTIIIALITLAVNLNGYSQASVGVGVSKSFVRSEYLQKTVPLVSFQLGGAVRYYPFSKIRNLSLQNEVLITRRGYDHTLGTYDYERRFNYYSIQQLINYLFVDFVSINAGLEFSLLLLSNVEEGNKIYREGDFSLVGGVEMFQTKRVSCFFNATYTLIPMFKTYIIDEFGNSEKANDLKFTIISMGLKVNIYNEKLIIYR